MKRTVLFFILIFSISNAQQKLAKDIFDIARNGTVEEVQLLEAKNKDTINAINPAGFTSLILACYKGNTTVASYLIKNVKNVNYNSSMGTALAAACVKGNIVLAKQLLENKADPNITDSSGMSPLLYAIQFKNKELIVLLLQFRANAKLADNNGKTPFEYAVFTKNQEIINLFKN